MQVLVTTEQIISIFIGFCTVTGIGYGLLYTKLKEKWTNDIELAIKNTCNEEKCKTRINSHVDTNFQMISKDLIQLKETINELKILVKNQQETLLAIQIELTKIGPRVDNIEKRLDKVERKLEL